MTLDRFDTASLQQAHRKLIKQLIEDFLTEQDAVEAAEAAPPPKKQRTSSASAAGGNSAFPLQLSRTKYLNINQFKGSTLVDLREYYDKDGVPTPGPKGIALKVHEWAALRDVLPQVGRGSTALFPRCALYARLLWLKRSAWAGIGFGLHVQDWCNTLTTVCWGNTWLACCNWAAVRRMLPEAHEANLVALALACFLHACLLALIAARHVTGACSSC